jgi:hypothetical protein
LLTENLPWWRYGNSVNPTGNLEHFLVQCLIEEQLHASNYQRYFLPIGHGVRWQNKNLSWLLQQMEQKTDSLWVIQSAVD